jgi:catechol 2,3-dioxygenase-like lactoylglutathione lyase family enzyme
MASTTSLDLTRIGCVVVPVSDTDRALDLYVGTLGFETVVDSSMGWAMRWVEAKLPGAETNLALAPPPPGKAAGGRDTGIILDPPGLEAAHAAPKAAGVDVDAESSRMGDPAPPVAWVRDPGGTR